MKATVLRMAMDKNIISACTGFCGQQQAEKNMSHVYEWLIFKGKTTYGNSCFRIRTLKQVTVTPTMSNC